MTADWSRPHWQPTGRAASVFYFVPGKPPGGGLQVSRSRHHIDDFPGELRVSGHAKSDDPAWFDGFFARPGLGSGIDETFGGRAGEVRAAARGTVIRGEFADPPTLDYLRNSVGVVSAVLEQGGLGVLDLLACRWWSKKDWLAWFVDRFESDVRDHVLIVSSDDDLLHPGLWVHTRGMRKFGRPDLQIKHVPGPWPEENPLVKAAGNLLNSLADYLRRGAVVEDRQTMSFPGRKRGCTFLLTPDDVQSEACHFGNEVLEVVDLVEGSPALDLNLLLEEVAG